MNGKSNRGKAANLQAYLRDIQRYPLLSAEEEHQLAISAATSKSAADKLITSNLRLVVKTAYEHQTACRNLMDLIQEGNIGLIQAVSHFDPSRNVKLSSYAVWWIRAYMLRFILANWRLVKMGTTQAQRKLFFNLSKERERLISQGIEPTASAIAAGLQVDEADVISMTRRMSSGEASLDVPAAGKCSNRLDSLLSQESAPDAAVMDSQTLTMFRAKLDSFRETLQSEKDITIFDARMRAADPLTLQEIGTRFGVSKERIRQLEARLMTQLKDHLTKEE